jgi:hypothetical protein
MERKLLVVALFESAIPKECRNPDTLIIGEESVVEKRVEALSSSVFDEAKLFFVPSEALQASVFNTLKSKGKLLVEGVPDRNTGQDLCLNLRVSGFIDLMAAKDPGTGSRFVVCQKPEWEIGSTAKLNVSTKVQIQDLAEEELIDESALLAETEVDVSSAAVADCGPDASGKKRACANCTCGLADQEKEGGVRAPQTIEEKIVKSSSCGNCYKGDAFRCGSCPFLGKPAFEPGNEKVVLSMGDDDI